MLVVALLIVFAFATLQVWQSPGRDEQKIKNSIIKILVLRNITYYDIAGKPREYTITDRDILNITRIKANDEVLWKVSVGESALKWNYYFDEKGKDIVKVEQIFRT